MKHVLLTVSVLLFPVKSLPALVQPTSIPGSYDVTTQPLSDIDSAMAWLEPEEKPVYGIYTWGYEFRSNLTRINEVGWTSIRMGGTLDDVAMLFVAQNPHLEVMYTIQGTRRDDCSSDADFLSQYMDHIKTQIGKYGPDGSFFTARPTLPSNPIMHWEIWNEPNFHYMWNDGSEAQREALYAQALPMAYDTIKHYAPTAQVVGFGAGGAGAGDMRWYSNVHAVNSEVASSYDVASTHPYVCPEPTETYKRTSWGGYSIANSLESLRSRMASYGRVGVPMWYTEIGWEISQAEGGTYERSNTVSQRLQAAYITRLYAYAMRLGVARVHPMFIVDSDGFNGGFFNDGIWREQAYATREMITQLPNPRLTGAVSDGVNGYYAYTFNPDKMVDSDETVLMAWNIEGPVTKDLPVQDGQTYVLVDMLGDSATFTASGATHPVEVGPCPVYLRKATPSPVRDAVRHLPAGPAADIPAVISTISALPAGAAVFNAAGYPVSSVAGLRGVHYVQDAAGGMHKTIILP